MKIRLAFAHQQKGEREVKGECEADHDNEDPLQLNDRMAKVGIVFVPWIEKIEQESSQKQDPVEGTGQNGIDGEKVR